MTTINDYFSDYSKQPVRTLCKIQDVQDGRGLGTKRS